MERAGGSQSVSTDPETEGNTPTARKAATCDQEVWVKARLETAIKMALAIHSKCGPRADEYLLSCGIEGIINGAAVEIIRTLEMEPEFTNLRRPKTFE